MSSSTKEICLQLRGHDPLLPTQSRKQATQYTCPHEVTTGSSKTALHRVHLRHSSTESINNSTFKPMMVHSTDRVPKKTRNAICYLVEGGACHHHICSRVAAVRRSDWTPRVANSPWSFPAFSARKISLQSGYDIKWAHFLSEAETTSRRFLPRDNSVTGFAPRHRGIRSVSVFTRSGKLSRQHLGGNCQA